MARAAFLTCLLLVLSVECEKRPLAIHTGHIRTMVRRRGGHLWSSLLSGVVVIATQQAGTLSNIIAIYFPAVKQHMTKWSRNEHCLWCLIILYVCTMELCYFLGIWSYRVKILQIFTRI